MCKALIDCNVNEQFVDQHNRAWLVVEKITKPLIVRLRLEDDHNGTECLIYQHPKFGMCCMDAEFIGVKMIKQMPEFNAPAEHAEAA
jgi:hypothetical protein